MKQIKILIIVTDLTLGGIQNYVRTLTGLLSEMTHKVFIIAINNAYPFENIDVISLQKYRSYQKPLFIKRFLGKNDIDVVLDHRTKSNILKQKVYDRLFKGIPKAQFIHSGNMDLYFYKSKFFNESAYKNTTMFISVSKYIDRLIRNYTKSDYELSYHFFDLKKTSKNINPDKKDILFAGRFENNVKDLEFLLNAYALSELYTENVKFHWVGAGNDEHLIRNFAQQKKLEDFILIHPATAHLETYYQQAKIIVLASHFEGFPLVVLESMFNGTPVLTTPFNPSVYEMILSGTNGIIIEKDLQKFAEALRKVFHDTAFYNELLKNLTVFDERFTKETAKKQWDIILDKLLKNRTSQTAPD